MKPALGASIAAVLLATAAATQPPPPPPGHDMPGLPIKRADVPGLVAHQFAEIDVNHDGAITEAEIRASRRARFEAMAKAHRDHAFAMMDANHDGNLSHEEFDTPPAPPPPPAGKGAADGAPPPPPGMDGKGPPMRGPRGFGMLPMGGHAFEAADTNQDGKVTLAEAQAGALTLFDKADANHDGMVDRDEVRAMMMARFHGPRGADGPGGDMPVPPPGS